MNTVLHNSAIQRKYDVVLEGQQCDTLMQGTVWEIRSCNKKSQKGKEKK